jgi:prolyl-tRNA editing enzyme YbaK/EbsC (Cys-tRNA(Pro) deacylase)
MSLESVRAFFAAKAPDIAVMVSPVSSATVALAAQAYGVEPGRIAKTLSLRIGERVVLIVASGTSRMDNKKVKALFGGNQFRHSRWRDAHRAVDRARRRDHLSEGLQ